MGMDGLEIVMDVEDHFGISIKDSEAVTVRTVGDLVAIIHGRIAAAHREPCPSLRAFLSLRNSVRAVTGDNSFRIRPRNLVAAKLTRQQRRDLWRRLPELLGTSPNGLRRHKLLRIALATTSICIMICAFWTAFAVKLAVLPLTLAMAVMLVVLLHFITASFRWFPPTEWQTFGEITQKITGGSVATKMLHLKSDDEILWEIRPILVDVLGVDASTIVPTARFVEDLGMD